VIASLRSAAATSTQLSTGLEFVVATDVARLHGPFPFFVKRCQHRFLNPVPAVRVNRMGDVRKLTRAGTGRGIGSHRMSNLPAAVRAIAGSYLVLEAAVQAFFGDFPTGHGHEKTTRSFNDLQVTHDKFVVQRDQAECSEAVFQIRNKFDADFGDVHGVVLFCDELAGVDGCNRAQGLLRWTVRVMGLRLFPIADIYSSLWIAKTRRTKW
jgi:hypothetical protein